MEVAVYSGLMLVALAFSLRYTIVRTGWLFFVIYLSCSLLLSVVVRSNYDGDIRVYADSMSYSSVSFYYLREPIVWFGHRFFYNTFGTTYAAFVLFDSIAFSILFVALRRFGVPQYVYFSILLFFPFVLGMQNVYRQWISSIIFIYSLSLFSQSRNILHSGLWFVLSALCHNVAAAFYPLIFLWSRRQPGRIALFGALLLVPVAVYIGGDTKSQMSSGADLGGIYLVFLILLSMLLLLLDRFVISKESLGTYKFLFFITFTVGVSVVVLSSVAAERVALFGLVAFYPFLALKLEQKFKQKTLMRVIFTVVGFVPFLLMGTRIFILP